MRYLVAVLAGCLALGGTGWAQTAAHGEDDDVVAVLLSRIDALEKRIADLEAQASSASRPATDGSGIVAAIRALDVPPIFAPPRAQEPAAALHPELTPATTDEYPSLKLRGFADVGYSAVQGTPGGFTLGQFVLHFASALSPKVSFMGETTFTPRSTAAVQTTPIGFNLEVERASVRFDHSDAFKLSVGRYHTPVSYWNTAFHHGLWLQTTISRPEMIQFGGSFLPVHFVGMLAEGSVPIGGLGLGYNIGIGNGRSSIISRGGDPGDVNRNRAWLAGVSTRPVGTHGIQVGATVYRDKISVTTQPDFGEWISSAHLVLTRETPEIIVEFANVRHRNLLTDTLFNSQAYYAQFAYRLPWNVQRWKPYFRFESINTPGAEPILGVPDLVGSTIGLRYDVSSYAALKSEYRNTRRGSSAQPRIDGFFFQTSVTF